MGKGYGRGERQGQLGGDQTSVCFCIGSPCLCLYILLWVAGVGLAIAGGIIMGVTHGAGPNFPLYMWGLGVGLLSAGCVVVAGCIILAVLICLGFISLDHICDKTAKYAGSSSATVSMQGGRYPPAANAYTMN